MISRLIYCGEQNIFFAAPWIVQRQRELGSEYIRRVKASWDLLMEHVYEWITVKSGSGDCAVLQVYKSLVEGNVADEGCIVFE
jgi:hypothetical protein